MHHDTIDSIAATKLEDVAKPALRGPFHARLLPHLTREAEEFAERAHAAGTALPFQAPGRLWLWYDVITGGTNRHAEPLPIMIHGADGRPLMLLPLCRTRQQGLDVITFADLGLTDYNAPLLAPGFAPAGLAMRRIWRAVRRVLPPADAVLLEKMPARIGALPNPLLHLPRLLADGLSGHVVHVGTDWEDYWNGLKRKFRKDQQRRWRRLRECTQDALRIERADPRNVDILLDMAITQKVRNLHDRGIVSAFDDAPRARFLRADMRLAVIEGRGALFAMRHGDKLLASVFGHFERHAGSGHGWRMTFATHATEKELARCAPGRLLTEYAMRELHQQGFRLFDFTIGDEGYKFDFGATPLPLWRLAQPLSLRGWKLFVREQAAAFLRRHPALRERLAKLRRS